MVVGQSVSTRTRGRMLNDAKAGYRRKSNGGNGG